MEDRPAAMACGDTGPAILLVDDSAAQRKLLRAAVARLGRDIREADSAEAALALCRNRAPDIVISDWMMPGASGLDLCDAIRAEFGAGYVYFIVLTSKVETQDAAEALNRGADDFLSKPVSFDELRARLGAGIRLLGVERELAAKNRLVNETLASMRALHAALDRDLCEARRLQMSLIPQGPRFCGGLRADFMLQSAGHVGGDLVGALALGDAEICVYGIDVSGHGIASALVTARLATWFGGAQSDRTVAVCRLGDDPRLRAPDAVAADLNALILTEIASDHYATLALARIDAATGRGAICLAGHPRPFVLRRNGGIEPVGDGGLPVGLLEGAGYEAVPLTLGPGDRLLIHSDGFTELMGQDGAMLGEDGFAAILERHRHADGPSLLEALKWEVSARIDDAEMPDDISAVLLTRDG
ncbi:fused response regulator/phosphatase [Palleronia sediminis]|uniref:Fused response regulator/phosphatase n=1 Tax=Palleronia sediminis TaxID=2547833 RepID=A0A4R6A620_9RHOB|nr:SpoIIE family protein phosphatase [Palleronia sediminis]TDL78154.1 fused response regulator/phosphatase [Palleronia sediminis]